ncbi:MAG: hypothetical protein ABXS91_10905, partial [Sulfurimonas sp.]
LNAGIDAKYAYIFDPESTTATGAGALASEANVEAIPGELTLNADGVTGTGIHDIPLSTCAAAGTVLDDAAAAASTGRIASFTVGATTYDVLCVDGSLAASPTFALGDGTRIVTK